MLELAKCEEATSIREPSAIESILDEAVEDSKEAARSSVGDESQSRPEILLNYASSLAARFKRSKKPSDRETAMEVSREVLCYQDFLSAAESLQQSRRRIFSAQTMSRQRTECFRKPSNYFQGSYPEASCGATISLFFLKFPGSQQMPQPPRCVRTRGPTKPSACWNLDVASSPGSTYEH
ncbi:hypothetical protein ACHAPE_006713 [Trichoderma viride]